MNQVCAKCGYNDNGTGDFAHLCNPLPRFTMTDTITLSIKEYEAMKIQAAIGKLVLEKFVSGNSVPVSRCYINASELESVAKEKP